MRNRSGSNPTRRIVDHALITQDQVNHLLKRVRYVGSGHHKRCPADYGLERTNPRPTSSLCDVSRTITLSEATSLLRKCIKRKMVSRLLQDGLPKYVWSVSDAGEVFEAKTHPNTAGIYHGYPLEEQDDMRARVLKTWTQR
jgi:hypothetical protein